MSIGVVDIGLGNIGSIANALEHLGASVKFVSTAEQLSSCERLLLPGVGAFPDGMALLRKAALVDTLTQKTQVENMPVLGICLGAQLMCARSTEFGETLGLGWVKNSVLPLKDARQSTSENSFSVPHVGWNEVNWLDLNAPVVRGIQTGSLFYFTHSFYIAPLGEAGEVGTCDYIIPFVAAFKKGNTFGVQFHPEKSQACGLKLLENFLNWNPHVA